MGEEFYCILKLVSSEEILSLIIIDENDGDPIIAGCAIIITTYTKSSMLCLKRNQNIM
jgi:hypothetical protein